MPMRGGGGDPPPQPENHPLPRQKIHVLQTRPKPDFANEGSKIWHFRLPKAIEFFGALSPPPPIPPWLMFWEPPTPPRG